MKKLKLYRLLATAVSVTVASPVSAQTPSLGIQLYAGLNITGVTGSVHVVQYIPALSQSNSWTSLTFLQLPVTNYLWVDTTAPATARRFYRALLQSPPTNMVFIPPSTFNLGTSSNELVRGSDEGPQTRVTITRGFWIGKFEVTQREYLAVTGENPSSFTGDLNLPVESLSWPAALNYCAKLTEQELAAGRIPAGSQYRLPTEAEWECAARAGTSTRFSYGDDPDLSDLKNYAWYYNFSNPELLTRPVGQKLPNPWGLYDMAGNVLEWTQDWYSPYPGGYAIDPKGPPAPYDFLSTFKVTRGGGFDSPDTSCRSASRGIFDGFILTDYNLGLRVVLAVGQP